MRLAKHLALGLALLAAPLAATAAPLLGSLDFTGALQGVDAAGQNVRLVEAVAVDFCANVTGACIAGTGGAFEVKMLGAGSNLPVGIGETGTIQDFALSLSGEPIINFFTVGGLSFDLNSIIATAFTIPPIPPATTPTDYLLVSGVGTLRAAGFDPTPGTFTLSVQSDGLNLLGAFTFSGGSAALPVPVPAPAGLALLGAGLLGLGLLRRKAA